MVSSLFRVALIGTGGAEIHCYDRGVAWPHGFSYGHCPLASF